LEDGSDKINSRDRCFQRRKDIGGVGNPRFYPAAASGSRRLRI